MADVLDVSFLNMQAIPTEIIEEFANNYSSGRLGFALKEITPYFSQFQQNIPSHESGYNKPTKPEHFKTCVLSLSPINQRLSLYSLCDSSPKVTGPTPDEDKRLYLLRKLVQGDGVSPLSLKISKVNTFHIRKDWFKAASRLRTSPSSCITASRAMLETICKTIQIEMGHEPDTSGDIGKLFKNTIKLLDFNFDDKVVDSIKQINQGFNSIINGISCISNLGGDRHGLSQGKEIEDETIAGFVLHISGSIALFISQQYLITKRTNN